MITGIDAQAIDRERVQFADTLEAVGPDAPTNAGGWTAHDVAAHVVSLDRFAGAPTFAGRLLVARGFRLNDLARRRPQLTERALRAEKLHGFNETIGKLRRPSPWLLVRSPVRVVGLFEVWAHHEDVRRPNGIERMGHPDLTDVISWLRRYSRLEPPPGQPPHDAAYWLAGRDGGLREI